MARAALVPSVVSRGGGPGGGGVRSLRLVDLRRVGDGSSRVCGFLARFSS